MAEDNGAVNGGSLSWKEQAYNTWLSRLAIAVEAGGVTLSESDCEVLMAVLLNEREKLAKALVVHT